MLAALSTQALLPPLQQATLRLFVFSRALVPTRVIKPFIAVATSRRTGAGRGRRLLSLRISRANRTPAFGVGGARLGPVAALYHHAAAYTTQFHTTSNTSDDSTRPFRTASTRETTLGHASRGWPCLYQPTSRPSFSAILALRPRQLAADENVGLRADIFDAAI